jgi:hypothetical protein
MHASADSPEQVLQQLDHMSSAVHDGNCSVLDEYPNLVLEVDLCAEHATDITK